MNSKSGFGRFLISFLRVLLGLIFILASIHKILDPENFMGTIYSYVILPDYLVPPVAYILPWIEIVIGLCLLLDIWGRSAGLLATGSLIVFITAIAIDVYRGIDISCGCFDFLFPEETIGWVTVGRDSIMILVAALVTLFDENRVRIYGLADKLRRS